MYRFLRDNSTWALGLLGLAAAAALLIYLAAHRIEVTKTSGHGPSVGVGPSIAPPAPIEPPVVPALIFENLTPQQALAENAATPVSKEPILPARALKIAFATPLDHDRALNCLTQAIYYEAGFESLQGRRAVAQVVLNRVRNGLFPKTVCGVVFQGSTLPTGCQFTFTCDGALLRPQNPQKWAEAKTVAQDALAGAVEKSVGHATHYHSVFVVPYWMPTLTKLVQIGGHIFYRWPGGMGAPAAFAGAYAEDEPIEVGAPPPTEPSPVVAAETPAAAPPPVPEVVETVAEPAPVADKPVALEAPVAPAATPAPAPAPPAMAAPPAKPDWFGTDRLRAQRAEQRRRAAALH